MNNKFVDKSVSIYKDIYDYKDVKYINAITKVDILCKKHNRYFYQENI